MSNFQKERDFQRDALYYFDDGKVEAESEFRLAIGVPGKTPKQAVFDIGSDAPPILVECDPSGWTANDNVPSAKLDSWIMAMSLLSLAPSHYRKVLFVRRAKSEKRGETLGSYFRRTYDHLIPDDVKLVEYDPKRMPLTDL